MLPGYAATATLYRSKASHIQRGRRASDGTAVVIKGYYEANIPAEVAGRLRYEHKILTLLADAGVRHVVRPVTLCDTHAEVAIVLEDAGAHSLRVCAAQAPLTLQEILYVAVRVAQALQDCHAARVVHKDLNPANIVFNRDSGAVQLIDFGIAAQVAHELQHVENLRSMEGTLPYVSPEQTGRTNRLLDYRSDFYSLGVTLYELLAGRLPFHYDDATELVHAILARIPKPLEVLAPDTPEVVIRIVGKLMEKVPERRYQSAGSLVQDLQRCIDTLDSAGAIAPFAIAENDRGEGFEIPQKLYGRAPDIQTMLQAYERVTRGQAEVLFVSGSSGIGKSALVGALQRVLVEHRAAFLPGKHDQLRRHLPFSAFGQAIATLVRRILMDTEAEVTRWRQLVQDVMGNVGQALIEIVPSLEQLVGKQKPLVPLGPRETENRLLSLLMRFMRAVCAKNPVVLFLDDLQWADSGTLRFLVMLCSDVQARAGLLVIGAYRDNEISRTHPLSATLETLRALPIRQSEIVMRPLFLADINAMLEDATGRSEDVTTPLAGLVLAKTAGNPFFVHTFVKHLWEKQLLRYDGAQHHWTWDLAAIDAASVADNVVKLVTEGLQRMAPAELDMLGLAACLGTRFSLQVLAQVANLPATVVARYLEPAIAAGVIMPLNGNYRYATDTVMETTYKFVHDRVHQAAYGSLSAERAQQLRYRIGRRLLENLDAKAPGPWVFGIIDHLNEARSLIHAPDEIAELIDLNLAAADESRKAIAYNIAIDYLETARALMPESGWDVQYDRMRRLHLDLAANRFLVGDLQQATAGLDEVLHHSRNAGERAAVQHRRMLALAALGRYADAVQVGCEALRLLGHDIGFKPSMVGLGMSVLKMRYALRGKDKRALARMPKCEDPRMLQIYTILTDMIMPSYFYHHIFFAQACMGLAYLTVRHGLSVQSAFAFSGYVVVLDRLSDFEDLPIFVDVTRECAATIPQSVSTGAVMFILAAYVEVFHMQPRELAMRYEAAAMTCIEEGDPLYSSWAWTLTVCYLGFVSLPRFLEIMVKHRDFIRLRNLPAYSLMDSEMRGLHCLSGQTRGPETFDTDTFSGAAQEAEFEKDRLGPAAGWYYTMRSMCLWMHRDMPKAADAARQALRCEAMEMVSENRIVAFYLALAFIGEARLHPRRRLHSARTLKSLLKRLRAVAGFSDKIFSGLPVLVEAELAALRGHDVKAMLLYEQAIEKTSESGYPAFSATALECAGRFGMSRGMTMTARLFMRRAFEMYEQWGATTKIRSLTAEFPTWMQQEDAASAGVEDAPTTRVYQTATTSKKSIGTLDLPAVLRACQALASETSTDALLELIVTSLIQCAGATRAVVLSVDAEQRPHLEIDSDPQASGLPEEIIRYVIRTREVLVATGDGAPDKLPVDPYLRRVQPKAAMCDPIVLQGQLKGVIYLENIYTSDVFSADKLVSVRLLATQAVISLQNARLLEDLEETVSERTREADAAHEKLLKIERESTELRMAGGFAHEMRNALGTASMVMESLQKRDGVADSDIDAATLATTLELVNESVKRALHVVSQVLSYAEASEGNRGNDQVELAKLVDSITQEMGQKLSNVELVRQVPTALQWPVKQEHAHTIVRNLLANARDAVAGPGRDPSARASIAVRATVEETHVALEIRDTGPGIPPQMAEHIFQPFYSTKGAGGAGLGLGLTRKLVELYGGSVAFSSDPGHGTVFVVRIPRS